ncbi:MAG: hypothetical protein A4E52_00167 [Pelotomaculum sp. PtaB.Bin013]|nr:MAG: hypothetical protein A4E52_00167 [Pelotomaculum sp. PtaB.Bin013]
MAARRKSKSTNGDLQLVVDNEQLKILESPSLNFNETKSTTKKIIQKDAPPNLGKAVRLKVPDFSDPGRPKTCLEVDFPIAPINALSALEGNAGKPIYQMSKWWARRRSSVFRSTLIAAATEAPEDPAEAAKKVWEHYYANHQKAGNFKNLKVLDNFMGGGTTLVEGARLGMQMYGVDLNPVAWLVVKNELSCSDPEEVAKLFEHIEAEVKPQIQPFYTTTCPRGHKGNWIDVRTNEIASVDPIDLPPEERHNYRWEGPEVIYTFWAKHGPCPATGCGHRTPVFRSPVVAEKKLSTSYIELKCPSCGTSFHAELGETRMAPGAPRVILPGEGKFTELSQAYARGLKDYSKGNAGEKLAGILRLLESAGDEPGLCCPSCGTFSGEKLITELERQRGKIKGYVNNEPVYDFKSGNVDKKALGIGRKPVYMTLLIHPEWLKGSPGTLNEMDLGGFAKATAEQTEAWFRERLKNLELIEVRGRIKLDEDDSHAYFDEEEYAGEDGEGNVHEQDLNSGEIDDADVDTDRKKYGLPRYLELPDGTVMDTRQGTVPGKSKFTCQNSACGRENDLLTAVKMSLSLNDMAEALKAGGYAPEWVDQLRQSGRLALVRQAIIAGEKEDKEIIELAADSNFNQNALEIVKDTRRTAPVATYALQCHCPACEAEGYNYNGRYFKAPDDYDLRRIIFAEREWAERKNGDLFDYWPKERLPYAWMTHHLNGGIPNWGYTHWWTMFNPRQLLLHSLVLRLSILKIKDHSLIDLQQVVGGLSQALNFLNLFCTYNIKRDHNNQLFANNNFYPKQTNIEVAPFGTLGNGNYYSIKKNVINGLNWLQNTWDVYISNASDNKSSKHLFTNEILKSIEDIYCFSSTDLNFCQDNMIDMVITDPPFSDNVFYADLADFFYVWLRIPMLKWYEDKPEAEYWRSTATPKTLEAIRNRAEHPDDREEWEKKPTIKADHLQYIRDYMQDNALNIGDPNPLYRTEPATEFYENTLTACWMEANRVLKPGGLLAFTFHHNDDRQWEAVLRSLFEAGFILVATYPIRSDETKGEGGAFGSRKIEYDILHVCRKRLEDPTPVSWAKMRRWVKEEVKNQQRILELYRNQDISEADIRVVLRGKALEFYSRHYGQVFTGSGEVLSIKDALLGINQLLDDTGGDLVKRPPESALPVTRLFLSLFQNTETLPRDDVHKMLRGTTVTIDDLIELGWVVEVNKKVSVVPLEQRFAFLTRPGKRRDSIKLDLDIAHFVIGAAFPKSGIDIQKELSEEKLNYKPPVEAILGWYAEMSPHLHIRQASELGRRLLQGWRKNNLIKPTKPKFVQYALDLREEGEVYDA